MADESRTVRAAALAFAVAGTGVGLAVASASFYATYFNRPYKKLSHQTWYDAIDADGRIKDLSAVRAGVLDGGIPSSLREEVWSALLGLRKRNSTSVEYEQGKRQRKERYDGFRRRCGELVDLLSKPVKGPVANLPSDLASFTEASRIIAADAPRTSFTYGTFARDWESGIVNGEDITSPTVDWRVAQRERLIRVLEAYAILDPGIGYTQGMNDLAAKFLRDVSNESEAFWCFATFMGGSYRCHFVINPHESSRTGGRDQEGVSDRLRSLGEIIKVVDTPMHKHLSLLKSEECMFAFRAVVVLMARELDAEEVGLLWDMLIGAGDFAPIGNDGVEKLAGGGAKLFLHVVAAALIGMRPQVMACKKADDLMQLVSRKLPAHHFMAHDLVKKGRELMKISAKAV